MLSKKSHKIDQRWQSLKSALDWSVENREQEIEAHLEALNSDLGELDYLVETLSPERAAELYLSQNPDPSLPEIEAAIKDSRSLNQPSSESQKILLSVAQSLITLLMGESNQ